MHGAYIVFLLRTYFDFLSGKSYILYSCQSNYEQKVNIVIVSL